MTRRLLALAEIYDGGSRSDAARIGDVRLQTVRDWVLRFTRKDRRVSSMVKPGSAFETQRRTQACARRDDRAGPSPAIHGVVRWRLIDLAQWIYEDYAILVTKPILSRELRALGYRKLSARPRHHPKDEAAAALYKKCFSAVVAPQTYPLASFP